MDVKILRLFLLLNCLFLFKVTIAEIPAKKWKVVTFKVYGNCGMCKTTIENSLKNIEGIKFAIWNEESKKITVKYNPEIIKLDIIHSKIAAVGYDTDKIRAKNEVYKKLHGCCQYERPINKE